ncbi:prolyl oligopeptidase family serine peptidase [Chryseobacterium wanjuense]
MVGHSHGGYESNFIATQSKLFAAYVAGAGNSDLVRSYHSYNYLWNGLFLLAV